MSGKNTVTTNSVKAAPLEDCCSSAGRKGTPQLQREESQYHRLDTCAMDSCASLLFFLKRLQGLVIWKMLSTICRLGTFIVYSLIQTLKSFTVKNKNKKKQLKFLHPEFFHKSTLTPFIKKQLYLLKQASSRQPWKCGLRSPMDHHVGMTLKEAVISWRSGWWQGGGLESFGAVQNPGNSAAPAPPLSRACTPHVAF